MPWINLSVAAWYCLILGYLYGRGVTRGRVWWFSAFIAFSVVFHITQASALLTTDDPMFGLQNRWMSTSVLSIICLHRFILEWTAQHASPWGRTLNLVVSLVGILVALQWSFAPPPVRSLDWTLAQLLSGEVPIRGDLLFLMLVPVSCASLCLFDLWKRGPGNRTSDRYVLLIACVIPLLIGTSLDLAPNLFGVDLPSAGAIPRALSGVLIAAAVSSGELGALTRRGMAERLLEEMSEGVLLIDTRAVIRRTNDAALLLAGYENLEGKPLAELLPYGLARDSGATELVHANGESIPVMVRASEVHDDWGQPLAWVCTFVDHREQQAHEHALAKALEEAESANRAKSAFLANVTHELKTPMNGVIGMATLLENTPLRGEQREMVGTIKSSGRALLHLISDILQISQVTSGQLTIEDEPFDPVEVVSSCVQVIGPMTQGKGLKLCFEPTPNLPGKVLGDPTRYRQVVLNLLSNAVKFTDAGRVRVTLEYHEDQLVCRVEDTGVGIDKTQQEAVFDAFVQADGSIRRRFGGTGLGLSICKQLCDAMGGTLSVESALGQGATFTFAAPMPEAAPRAVDAALSTLTVGLSDISTDDVRTLSAQFTLLGVQCTSVHDASVDLWVVDATTDDAMDAPCIGLSPTPLAPSEKHFAMLWTQPLTPQQISRSLLDWVSRDELEPEATEEIPTALTKLRVLIAEDNPVNQIVAQRMVKQLGVQHTRVANNGVEAIEAMDKHDIDVVLMDLQMPEMDGLEATRQIRVRWPDRRVHILALTANTRPEDEAACEAAGMDGHIGKPISLDALRDTLLAVARNR